jgi:hypothetical protein
MSAGSAIVTIFFIQFFKVALSEEFLMSCVREALSIKKVKTSYIYLISAASFAILHHFRYLREAELQGQGYPIGPLISAFGAGILFTHLFLSRGIIAAIAAHGTYNFLFDIIAKTNLAGFILIYIIYAIILVAIIYAIAYYIGVINARTHSRIISEFKKIE